MAKDFKIVEPEFVSRTKQSAVAAVEARFAREESQRRKVERRARAKGCLAWLILLAIVSAAGAYFACRHYGISFSEVTMRVHEAFQTRRYERLDEMFRVSPLAYWKEAPDDLRPNKVATNTIYHAMMSDGVGRMILEMQASPDAELKIRRLSPIAAPVEMPLSDFNRLVAKAPYLVAVGGKVYFCCGKRSPMDKENFRRELFSAGTPGASKKVR